MESAENCRVLSIQSYVISGYVGNKSATFPLQILGFEIDAINSVQFSNHTGYKTWQGQVLSASDLACVYSGLQANCLNCYSHLLTGYIGSSCFLLQVKEVIQDLKKINPDLIYVCDPVMGDDGKLYVPEDLVPVYRNDILPLADVITPNKFEAELLTGLEITDLSSAAEAMKQLLSTGVRTVVISSMELGSTDTLMALASTVTADGTVESFVMKFPRFNMYYSGSGDLFTALLLAWMHRHPGDLKLAMEKVVSTMQLVLRRTLDYAEALAGSGKTPTLAQKELRLIQSKSDIENPRIVVEAVPLICPQNGPAAVSPS